MAFGSSNQSPTKGVTALLAVKVMDIILDLKHPKSEQYGFWDGLGTIFYIRVDKITGNPTLERDWKDSNQLQTARPIFANQKYYPLVGEIVLIMSAPAKSVVKPKFAGYYLPNINIWNHPHHNAVPNPLAMKEDSTNQDYKKAQGGLVRHVTDGSTDIKLGKYFKENLNTKPLLPYEGDHILEGRFGNSIRFGSTIPTNKIDEANANDWSEVGNLGDPITIIRNGQSDELDDKGWEPTIEDINRDNTSIYLTSDQQISSLNVSFLKWESWGAEYEPPVDNLLALTQPPIEEVEEVVVEEEELIIEEEGNPSDYDPPSEQMIEEDEAETPPPAPEVEEEDDELSMYDELIESGDYDEDDFEEIVGFAHLGEEIPETKTVTKPDGTTVEEEIDLDTADEAESSKSGNLGVVLLNQQDKAWKDIKTYLNNGKGLSVGPSGCCLTSCAMVASYNLGKVVTPVDLMGSGRTEDKKDSTPNGSGVLVEWNQVGKYMGKKYTPKWKGQFKKGNGPTKDEVKGYLTGKIDAGIPVIWEKLQSGQKRKKYSSNKDQSPNSSNKSTNVDTCIKVAGFGTSKQQTGQLKKYVWGNQHWMVVVGYNMGGDEPTFQVNDPSGAAMRETVPLDHLVNTLGRFVTWE